VLVALLALAFALPLAPAAQAQTPAATVKDDNGKVVLKSFVDGGLLAPEQNGGAIPKKGPGARMMWYPGKAAFRAGEVGVGSDGKEWNDTNVGTRSVAFGVDTKASGSQSTAMGAATTASGLGATAMGFSTTASGTDATAMGRSTTASGDRSTAMGSGTTASGTYSTAMGSGTTASGNQSTAMGRSTTAETKSSLSIGRFNNANTSDDNSLFVAGNGTGSSRSDALVLDDAGNLEIAGTLTENSDRRLKTDIDPLSEGVLGALGEIDPVRYRFKNEQTHPSGEQIGLIAQEVRTQFPELVREGADGMLSLAYPKLTAVLLKGLQEQQSTIEEQKGRIAALETQTDEQSRKIADLKAENEEIKTRLAALEADRTPSTAGWAGGRPLRGLGVLLVGGLLGAGFLALRRR
jgi:hypothetical protein